MKSGVAEPLSDRQPAGEALAAEMDHSRAQPPGRLLADMTGHARAEQRLVAQHVVAHILAESPELSEAILRILQAMCESLGWATSALWRVDRETDVLRCVEMWHLPSVEVPEFEAVTRQWTFARGVGMPGRVWASGAPAWIPDVVTDPDFPRAPIAAREGLHAALGLPIRLGSEILGVLEFFSPEIRSPDEELLQMMATVGSQIGQFIERKRAEEERERLIQQLEAERARLETVLRQMPAGVIIAEAGSGRLILANEQIEAILGTPFRLADSIEDYQQYETFHPDGRPYGAEELPLARSLRTGEVVTDEEIQGFRADGTLITALVSSAPIRDREGRIIAGAVTLYDITQRKQTEEQLKASLREKEVLLKEIHHRVRNNLQIVSSLLNLQASYSKDPQTLALFKDSQHRVKSMALVHEHLYQSTDLTKIDMAAYIQNLVMHLVGSYRLHSELVRPLIEVEEIFLGIDTAIPCGLIVTELLSNCLKHAFPAGQAGEIRIELRPHPNGTFLLRVSDSGVGLPPNLDFHNPESLGLQLVCALTEQLDGTIELERHGGTAVTISFAELTYKTRN